MLILKGYLRLHRIYRKVVCSIYKRRKPADSYITENMLRNVFLGQLYDFIRALTDPYSNAYLKDGEGN